MSNANTPRTVGIYLFDKVEVLDFAEPFEVFTTAARVSAQLKPDTASPFTVMTIAEKIHPVQACGEILRAH